MQIRVTPVVFNLLIINGLIFLIQLLVELKLPQFQNIFQLVKANYFNIHPTVEHIGSERYIYQKFLLPYGPGDFQWYQIITYFFSHGGFLHILFNMIALFSFGPPVELILGAKRFLTFYLFSGIVGGILIALFDPSPVAVVGASGAISGVLLAFALYYPQNQMIIFPLPFPISAKKFVIGFAVISIVLLIVSPTSGGVSHFGHLAGMVAAGLYFIIGRFLNK